VIGGYSFGPTAAVEFEPIKSYLVIEAGIPPFFDSTGHPGWDFDLLFRRPIDLSKTVEFEPGTKRFYGEVGRLLAKAKALAISVIKWL
jgi:hypothetical protein